MPSKADLPPGIRRDFAVELHEYFKQAGRPSLARIAMTTSSMDDPLPVSRETIRRLLTGQTLSTWEKVDAVLRALCKLSYQDPESLRWPEESGGWNESGDPTTRRQHLQRLWNDAVDGIDPEDRQPTTEGPWFHAEAAANAAPTEDHAENPWLQARPPLAPPAPQEGYSDDPPF
ncbi:hypothetical protein ACFWJ5_34880 [Streptomyces qaidamensis]|uniref:hypothetical protein n=1 Tax=Streptomyces qaidamensis TaxID=1783515 RepID=UPI00365F2A74